MALRSKAKWVLAAGMLAGLVGTAVAQTGGRVAPQATPSDAEIDFATKSNLSPEEQLASVDKGLIRVDQARAGVRRQLEDARRAKDVVKTLCVDDKLSQIDVAARSARERRGTLKNAVERKDREQAGHEFTIVSVLFKRAQSLVSEANACIGEEATYVGETKTTTTIDPRISESEEANYPTQGPGSVPQVTPGAPGYVPGQNPGGLSDPPQCVSCTR